MPCARMPPPRWMSPTDLSATSPSSAGVSGVSARGRDRQDAAVGGRPRRRLPQTPALLETIADRRRRLRDRRHARRPKSSRRSARLRAMPAGRGDRDRPDDAGRAAAALSRPDGKALDFRAPIIQPFLTKAAIVGRGGVMHDRTASRKRGLAWGAGGLLARGAAQAANFRPSRICASARKGAFRASASTPSKAAPARISAWSATRPRSTQSRSCRVTASIVRRIALEVELFGRHYAAPIGIAPMGLQGLMWPGAERHLARAAQRARIPGLRKIIAGIVMRPYPLPRGIGIYTSRKSYRGKSLGGPDNLLSGRRSRKRPTRRPGIRSTRGSFPGLLSLRDPDNKLSGPPKFLPRKLLGVV